MVELLPPLVVLPLVELLLLRKRKRKRKRVRYIQEVRNTERKLTQHAEKEESDEDMGFGLFD